MAAQPESIKDKLSIVLIGCQGSGKSSTGNTILGQEFFDSMPSQIPFTYEEGQKTVVIGNKQVTVVDTPALRKVDDFKTISVLNAVYVLVIRIGRSTLGETKLLQEILKRYNSLQGKTIIVFTSKREITNGKDKKISTIEDWLKKNPELRRLIDSNNLKYTEFENNLPKEDQEKHNQVEKLLSIVSEIKVEPPASEIKVEPPASEIKVEPPASEIKVPASEIEVEPPAKRPVSENNLKIFLTKSVMETNFGNYGKIFWDEQFKNQHE